METKAQVLSASMLVILALIPRLDARQMSAKVTEETVRRLATVSPRPAFPASSVKAKVAGVAVAAVVVGTNGEMALVTVLQAPDNAIREAVTAALRQWKVTPMRLKGEAENREMTSRIIFYYVLRPSPVVLNPDEVDGGPNWKLSPIPAGSRRPAITPQRPSLFEPLHEIAESELSAVKPRVILDVGERDEFLEDHHKDAVNIPVDELLVRGGIELPRDVHIVIDCHRNPEWYKQSAILLNSIGFGRVLLLMPKRERPVSGVEERSRYEDLGLRFACTRRCNTVGVDTSELREHADYVGFLTGGCPSEC